MSDYRHKVITLVDGEVKIRSLYEGGSYTGSDAEVAKEIIYCMHPNAFNSLKVLSYRTFGESNMNIVYESKFRIRDHKHSQHLLQTRILKSGKDVLSY